MTVQSGFKNGKKSQGFKGGEVVKTDGEDIEVVGEKKLMMSRHSVLIDKKNPKLRL